jgi:hypothetical protein
MFMPCFVKIGVVAEEGKFKRSQHDDVISSPFPLFYEE